MNEHPLQSVIQKGAGWYQEEGRSAGETEWDRTMGGEGLKIKVSKINAWSYP